MDKFIITGVFAVMVLAQWFVPGNMIYQEELVLNEGTAYKFKTAPIDPSDPFRGKYIMLNFEMNSFETSTADWYYEDPIYVYLVTDSLGYAKADDVTKTLKETDQDYVIAQFAGYYNETLHFSFPFDMYYMNEKKAYDAELVVRNVQRDSLPANCYGVVYIKGDRAVLNDVQIDGISIKDYVENP